VRRLFWGSMAILAWTYVGFPLVVLARAIFAPRPHVTADVTPSLSILIAAHNEVAVISDRLRNIGSASYPRDRIEIIVASDGSDDGTDDVVAERAAKDPAVCLLKLPRAGKPAALNAAAAAAHGEVLVFTDANSQFAADALRVLVRSFDDPSVGCVAGDQVYIHHGHAAGERGYWQLDRWLKKAESAAGSAVSATGAIYAIRRHLYADIPDGVSDDFAISTGVILHGFRLVFAPDAIAYEPVVPGQANQYSRRVRIVTGGFRAFEFRRALFNPFRFGFYAIELLSHKFLRRLMGLPLLGLLLASIALRRRRPYAFAAMTQVAFYSFAVVGALTSHMRVGSFRILNLPAFFCMSNIASLHGLLNTLRGTRIRTWSSVRDTEQ
jgi:cellulose synthase/poly-beta-1,6-N-acetylglucosamine synthase-like glycosyltransferase